MNPVIILIWWTALSGTAFESRIHNGKDWHVFTTTSAARFEEEWNKLGPDSRANSKVFKGEEQVVQTKLEISSRSKISEYHCPVHGINLEVVEDESGGRKAYKCPSSGYLWDQSDVESSPPGRFK